MFSIDSHSFLATYLVDLFIYTYGINCRVDSCVFLNLSRKIFSSKSTELHSSTATYSSFSG